jgi:hypothetical protein
MTAITKPVVFSWLPKGGGKGGQFSNASSHDADTDMLSFVNQLYISGGKWLGWYADSVFGNYAAGTYPLSVFCFNSFSSVNQQYYSFLMTSHYKATAIAAFQRGYFTSAGALTTLDGDGIGVHNGGFFNPTVFQAVKNKVYASNGMTFTQNAGGLVGPRIYYDNVGDGAALIGANWGLPTPVPNLQVIPDPNSYQVGTCTTTVGSPNITVMSFDPTVNLAAGMPFYIESAAGSGQYYEFIIQAVTGPATLTLTTNWIGAGYAGAKCQGNYGSLTWGASQPNIVVGTATTNGTGAVTAIAGFDAQVYCKVGYRMMIETSANSQVWNTYTITGIVSPTAVNVAPNTVESYAGARVRVDLPATSSGISSDSSYQYAISYYDSVRGHIGNPGPIYTVNWGPPFNKRINLKILNITDAPLQGGTGKRSANWTYDKILLWRTASNGAVLQARVLLTPAGGGGGYVQTFTDNQSDDTQLGLVGPVGAGISTRLTSHGPPPDDLNYATYWEGRFFGSSTSNPGVLYWTALAGQEIDFYGVPEECWPPLNTLTIPETDGSITGLRTVGSALLVMTQNNIYQLVYNTTNTSAPFRLQRLSAKGSGTNHWASATMPGEDAQSGDILIHFGNDKRLYLLYGAGGDIPISYPVQDIFNQFTDPTLVRVGVRHTSDATYIVVLPGQISGVGFPKTDVWEAYLYDVDRKVWLTVVEPQSCFTEGIFNGVTTAFVGGLGASTINKMAGSTNVVSNLNRGTFQLESHFVTPPGLPRMDEKNLQAVIIWAQNLDPGTYFTVAVDTDDGLMAPVTLTRLNTTGVPFLQVYADAPNCYVYVPSVARPVSGRTFRVNVTLLPGTLRPTIYEVMAMWSSTVDAEATGGVV